MTKISLYPENNNPDPNSFILIETEEQDGKYKTPLGNLISFPFRQRMTPFSEEFMGGNVLQMAPFNAVALSSGTFARIASEANHPGIWRIAASAAGNAGYALRLGGLTSVLFQGGEVAEFIVRIQNTAGVVLRIGFHDTVTTGAETDSAYFFLSNSTSLSVITRNNSTATTTAIYTITTNTWYRFKIQVADDESSVIFTVYDENGTVLATVTHTTNIPTTRNTSLIALAYRSTASAANLLDIDWVAFYKNRLLTR